MCDAIAPAGKPRRPDLSVRAPFSFEEDSVPRSRPLPAATVKQFHAEVDAIRNALAHLKEPTEVPQIMLWRRRVSEHENERPNNLNAARR